MDTTPKLIEIVKEMYQKEEKEITDQEAEEAALNLGGFLEATADIAEELR